MARTATALITRHALLMSTPEYVVPLVFTGNAGSQPGWTIFRKGDHLGCFAVPADAQNTLVGIEVPDLVYGIW